MKTTQVECAQKKNPNLCESCRFLFKFYIYIWRVYSGMHLCVL